MGHRPLARERLSDGSSSTKLVVSAVSFSYATGVPLFQDLHLTVPAGVTVLLGGNGSGKSTLLALVAGEFAPEHGQITISGDGSARRMLVNQRTPVAKTHAILDFEEALLTGDAEAWRLSILFETSPEEVARFPAVSPGEARRVLLAAALFGAPDLLLLDEPTNHVDEAGREALRRALRRYPGVVLLVSHDRRFAESIADRALLLERPSLEHACTVHSSSSVSGALEEADARHKRALDTRDRLAKQVHAAAADLARSQTRQATAERGLSIRKRMKSKNDSDAREFGRKVVGAWAEARAGRTVAVDREAVHRAEAAQAAHFVPKALGRHLFANYTESPQRRLLAYVFGSDAVGTKLTYVANSTARGGSLLVDRGARVRLVGPNGSGKSTLLRALHALGSSAHCVYFPQEHSREEIQEIAAKIAELAGPLRGAVYTAVAALGTDPKRFETQRSGLDLSPGEAKKLLLAYAFATSAALLLLDEPTNHLDLVGIQRLEEALAPVAAGGFPGAIVYATHDEAFAEALGGEIHAV